MHPEEEIEFSCLDLLSWRLVDDVLSGALTHVGIAGRLR